MRAHRASATAVFVAACRGLAPLLPSRARLVTDPFGARVLGAGVASAVDVLSRAPAPVRALAWGPLLPLLPWTLYMQVRTRALDDALRAFIARGGRQVVILGAGFDARATRLRDALAGAAVYEVDHPSTQSEKRARFGGDHPARFLAWDFERDPLTALPARLASLGHDPSRPTFTLWEGVTMYLTREAIAATLDAVRAYSAEGSALAFNYIDRGFIEHPGALGTLTATAVRALGEPFRGGFTADEMRAMLAAHGFGVDDDRSFEDLARAMLPAPWSWLVRAGRRMAVGERTTTAGV